MNNDPLPGWTDTARCLLDAQADACDSATLSRLNRVRQAALAARAPRLRIRWLPTGLASACALLLAVGAWQARKPVILPATPATAPVATQAALDAEDLDLVGNGDTLEMMQDLDFYAWLGEQDGGGEG